MENKPCLLKKINYKLFCIILLALLIACIILGILFIKPAYQPSFSITGDVKQVVKVESMQGWKTYTAQRSDGAHTSLKLSELIDKAAPYSDPIYCCFKR